MVDDKRALRRVRERLLSRRLEVEQTILARIVEVSPAEISHGEIVARLQRTVSVGVSHGISNLESHEEDPAPLPAELSSHTRHAARTGIALDLFLRNCFMVHAVLFDFIMQVAAEEEIEASALRRMLRGQSSAFEQLLGVVVAEYEQERGARRPASDGRQVALVRGLLAGADADPGELAYELRDWHIGAIANGQDAERILRDLATAADRRLLLVRPELGTIWAWFGGRRRTEMARLAGQISLADSGDAIVALGEPARGVSGWRLTHQQANVAFGIARRGDNPIVRYADVGLLASISQDHLLASSLHEMYIAPLSAGRDRGARLRETLRAYFSAGRNVSSAASALGVSRQTVGNRLRIVEERLGRTLETCAPEVEVALRLESIGETS
jgi:hypothetical protein